MKASIGSLHAISDHELARHRARGPMVLTGAARLTAIGLGGGLIAAGALRWATAWFAGIDAAPAIMVMTVALSTAVAVAAWMPARRAARFDPILALPDV